MDLFYFNKVPNFGDALNSHLFPKIFPAFPWGQRDNNILVGIGSILDKRLNVPGHKIIVGSGIRDVATLPNFNQGSWDLRFVRGPISARATGAPYITDAAYAWVLTDAYRPQVGSQVSFVPHMGTVLTAGKIWEEVCNEVGIQYVDPCSPFQEVLNKISNSRLVIAEAMHGAIFADIYRIPWVPVQSMAPHREGGTHKLKWQDWATSLGLDISHSDIGVFWSDHSILGGIKLNIKKRQATRRLAEIAKNAGYLSADSEYSRVLDRLSSEIENLKKIYSREK